jgi:hypothetical protein
VKPAGTAGTSAGAPNEPTATGVTYYRDIRPVLQSECVACHAQGGIGPFPLDTWEAVMPVAATVVAAVSMHVMPPWPASDSCHELLATGAEIMNCQGAAKFPARALNRSGDRRA